MKPERHANRLRARAGGRLARAILLALLLGVCGAQARAQLTVQPVTWNIIGLDSVASQLTTKGPDTFQAGVRACNTSGATLNNLVGTFIWDSFNAYINLAGPSMFNVRSLAPGACSDIYFTARVARTSAAWGAARRYRITVSADGVAPVSTPTQRELFAEQLLSQRRNFIRSITGPTTVYVGQTYQYTLVASTATQGYEQIEAFLDLPNVIFQVVGISTTYSAPAGATNDKFYADACGWDNNPLSPTYKSCIGPANYPGDKAGGELTSVYTVKILSTGTTVASALILDVSGGSYHYNADYGEQTIAITALPPPLTLAKLANPSQVTATPGAVVTYTLRLTNSGASPYTVTDFVDTPPATPATASYVPGSSAFNGAAVADPLSASGRLTWRGSFTVPAGQSRDFTYRMTIPVTPGTYTNSAVARIDYIQIDTTQDTNDNAPATASVVRTPPNVTLVKSVTPSGTAPPGEDLAYTIQFNNTGGAPASSFVVTDPIPANTDFKVGSPAQSLGTTGLTATVSYSNDGGATWTYVPAGGAGGAPAGYDRTVTHVRWSFGGSVPVAPDDAGSVSFAVRIR